MTIDGKLLHWRALGFLMLVACCLQPAISVYAQPAIPALSGRVVDRASILNEETERLITSLLAAHEDTTSNQVVVLTIPSLEGANLESYSLEVARTWALGREDRNNGVLLLIAYNDRKMRIEVGYGLEGDLPDAMAKRIIDYEMTPAFRNGDFDGGVLNGVRAIVGTIEGSYEPAESSSNDIENAPIFVRLIFGFMFIGVPGFMLFLTSFAPGCMRWFMMLFFIPFFLAGGTVLAPPYGGVVITVLILLGYIWLQWQIKHSPKWEAVREAMAEAKKTGKAVAVEMGGWNFNVGGTSRSGGGGFSGGGSSFSGGGGSFGGGGASGGW